MTTLITAAKETRSDTAPVIIILLYFKLTVKKLYSKILNRKTLRLSLYWSPARSNFSRM